MPRRPPPREPPPELDCDMTASDIADELRALKFNDGKQFNAVKLDADVRDFLVSALARHVSRRD
jgi:hypothetical protein